MPCAVMGQALLCPVLVSQAGYSARMGTNSLTQVGLPENRDHPHPSDCGARDLSHFFPLHLLYSSKTPKSEERLGFRWLSFKTSWLPVPYERRGAQRAQPARVTLVKFLVLLHRRGWGASSHRGTRGEIPRRPERSGTVCYLVPPPGGDCSFWLFFLWGCWQGGRGEGRQEKGRSVGSRWSKQDLGPGLSEERESVTFPRVVRCGRILGPESP